jgi:hypothetical protein
VKSVWRYGFVVFRLATQLIAADVTQGEFGAARSSPDQRAPTKPKRNSYPFYGEVEFHDAQSITLKGKRKSRVLLVTPETRIQRNGSRASLDQVAAGERITGSARKNVDGKEEAVTVHLKTEKTIAK